MNTAADPGRTPPVHRLVFAALGTACEVRYAAARPVPEFEADVRTWVDRFESRYSRFRPTSLVSRINAAAGAAWIDVDPEMEQMLNICSSLHAISDGILDATAGPLLRLWNYKEPPTTLPDDVRIAAARALVGWPQVQRQPGRAFLPQTGMSLDFGGWGKEWAVDAVAHLAVDHGLRDVLVDFGHDIHILGTPPGRPAWHVGLEDPTAPGTHRGSIALHGNKAVASSGDYLRHFTLGGRRFGHIVDPRTGWPVAHPCRQVTVIADSCFQAGILSTTAFVLGPEKGLAFIQRFPGTEALIVTDTERNQTRGFWNYVVS